MRRASLVVFVVVLAAYANTVGNYLVWSDFFQIRDGHMVVKTLDQLRTLYLPDQLFENNYYRPVQVLSNTIDWHLWSGSYWGFHATSVVLHAINAVLVLAIAYRIFACMRHVHALPLAIVTALVWAIHPFKSESVAWIADRGTLLQVFTLGALLLGLRCLGSRVSRPVARHDIVQLVLAGALFVLGLLSKEIALVMPVLLLSMHWLLRLPWSRRATGLYAGLFSIAGLYLVVRRLWLWHPPALSVLYPLQTRVLSQPPVLVDYLRGLFWPASPTASDVIELHTRLDAEVLAAVALLVGLAGVASWVGRRQHDRLWPWAVGWFLVCVAPTSNLLLQRHFRGERYLYLASFGIVLATVVSADHLVERLVHRLGGGARLSQRIGIALAAAVLLVLGVATTIRNRDWSANDANNEVFFAHELAGSPQFREALGNLCRGRARQGEFEQAMAYCRRGWDIDPTRYSSTAWQPLGFHALMLDIYDAQGDCASAMQLTREAVVRFPQEREYRERLVNLRRHCGRSS